MADANIKRPQCSEYTGELCEGMLTHYYHDPTNKLFQEVERNEGLLRAIYRLAPRPQCLSSFARFVCSRYVMSCTEVPVTLSDLAGNLHVVKYALPVLANSNVCQKYQTDCADFRGRLSATAKEFVAALPPSMGSSFKVSTLLNFIEPNCDTTAPVGAQYECDSTTYSGMYKYFPEGLYYQMDLGITTATIKTQNFDYDTQYDQSTLLPFTPPISCPAPLVVWEPGVSAMSSQLLGGSCAQPCPSMLFSQHDYKTISTLAIILCTISILASAFLLISYLCFKEIRQGNYFLQFLACIVVITFAFAIGVYIRFDPSTSIQQKYCKNNTDLGTQTENPGCTIQAFLVQFAFLSLSAFFASSGFDLFLKIVLTVEIRPNTQYDYLLSLAYYFWGWTVPLTLTVVAAATESLGPGDLGVFFCFVHGRNNGTVPWATAYLPIMIQLFIGCISLSTTIFQLVKLAKRQQADDYERQLRDHNYRPSTAPTLRLANYTVPLFLELVFFCYLMFIVLFRAAVFFSESGWKATATTFVSCLLFKQPFTEHIHRSNPLFPIAECGDKPETIKVGVWYFYQCFLSLVGVATFLVLGTQKIYYQLWSAVVGYYLNIPGLLVWAATTHQAKIYAKRLAKQRRDRQKQLLDAGKTDQLAREAAQSGGEQEIVDQVKQQAQMIKDQERAVLEEKQKKERERQEKQKEQQLNMIAPHLRPMYLVQQRPRKLLPSLIDLANQDNPQWGPKPSSVPDIFELFQLAEEVPHHPEHNHNNNRRQRGGKSQYQSYYEDDFIDDFE